MRILILCVLDSRFINRIKLVIQFRFNQSAN